MGTPTVGDVISCPFHFSDLSTKKIRPAIVVAVADYDNIILCQITSKAYSSSKAIPIEADDFSVGGLPRNSYGRPDKLFTADQSIIKQKYGRLSDQKTVVTLKAIRDLFDYADSSRSLTTSSL